MKNVYKQHLNPTPDKPLRQQLDSGSDAAAAAERAWLEQRSTDPALTDVGQAEAVAFGRYYAPLLRAASPSGVRVFVSPFLRTCQTAAPLVQALGAHARVTLRGDICEVGGCYTATAAAPRSEAAAAGRRTPSARPKRGGPGHCMSPAELRRRFPAYGGAEEATARAGEGVGDAEASAGAGAGGGQGWWRGGWENDAEAWKRAKRVATWLQSEALRDDLRGAGQDKGEIGESGKRALPFVVIVSHAAFIDLLLKALVEVPPAPAMLPGLCDEHTNKHYINGAFRFRNTATGLLTIQGDGTVHLLNVGGTEHLANASVAADQQSQAGGGGAWSTHALSTGVGMAGLAVGLFFALKGRL